MLYSFKRGQVLPSLSSAGPLTFLENDSPELMAIIGNTTLEEAEIRFMNANKAYVAFWDGKPAAFGWVSTDWSRVGELDHKLLLPSKHYYLWNFRTLAEHRGKGIYPRLLQHILISEIKNAECFWIMHAPENEASEKGISKAGFHFQSKVTVTPEKEVIVFSEDPSAELSSLIRFGNLVKSEKEQASCWNCSSPFVKNRKAECCCAERSLECNYLTAGT